MSTEPDHKKMKLWCIEWVDAQSIDEWSHKVDDPSLAQIVTVGFIINETKDVVQICLNVDTTNDAVSCVMNIPKVNITRRKRLCLLTDLKKTTQSK